MSAFAECEVLESANDAQRMAHRINGDYVLNVEKLRMCGFTKRKAQKLVAKFNRRNAAATTIPMKQSPSANKT
jgi:hypothetical protein